MRPTETQTGDHGGLRALAATGPAIELPALELTDPERLIPDAARAWLDDAARRALAAMLTAGGQVLVRLVDDVAMARAHEEYADTPGTTDVLTFDLTDGHSAIRRDPDGSAHAGAPLDVEILACVDEARRQAAARGHAVERELLLYILHGVLHCLGYDDHDPAAFAAMHAEEDRLLTHIGVGPVFARPEDAKDAGGGRP